MEISNVRFVRFVKAFGIKAEANQYYPELNFTETVSMVLETSKPDAIILQAGSIEISNIDIKKAYMDTEKDIDQYQTEWASKVEEDSTNLFDIATKALKKKANMKIIIVKRLPRYDPVCADPKGIKRKISDFANSFYDQLWFKRGGPKNIFVVDIDLQCSDGQYLKDLIYAKSSERNYNGIHLRGEGASRHFSYRAANVMKSVLCGRGRIITPLDNHSNCP